MSPKLQAAIEVGELKIEQLRELIEEEDKELGLTFADAQRMAKDHSLTKNALGSDLEFVFQLLPSYQSFKSEFTY